MGTEGGTGGEVEVGSGIQLSGYDVDIVASHAGRKGCEACTVVAAGKGMEFAIAGLVFHAVEYLLEHVHAVGVAH